MINIWLKPQYSSSVNHSVVVGWEDLMLLRVIPASFHWSFFWQSRHATYEIRWIFIWKRKQYRIESQAHALYHNDLRKLHRQTPSIRCSYQVRWVYRMVRTWFFRSKGRRKMSLTGNWLYQTQQICGAPGSLIPISIRNCTVHTSFINLLRKIGCYSLLFPISTD